MEAGVQTPEETLAASSGSCRDSAWLLVQILRHLGLAARFVSGYLIQLRPDVRPLDGPAGAAQDFTDLHAWAEVYLPGAGWIGLDPTSGLVVRGGPPPARRHAALPRRRADQRRRRACGGQLLLRHERHAHRGKAARHLSVLRRRHGRRSMRWANRSTRISPPHDVRLTMGGEPTFVSIDDYQSAEWNTAALGPTKRARADELIRRLRERFAPGGLLHYGQGKWYPGEPLPRWAFALYWRRDGKPIWRDAALIATETASARPLADEAQRFARSARAAASASMPTTRSPPTKIRPSGCSSKASCRRTSIRAIPRSTTRSSAPASCANSSVISARRRATCCRCSAGARRPQPAGSARSGRRGAGACSSCRAIRRSASACRSARCRMSKPIDYPHLVPADP